VVADVRQYALDAEPQPAYYTHVSQLPDQFGFGLTMNVVARTEGDAAPILVESRNIVRQLDPTVVVSQATTMQSHVSRSVARSRFAMMLLGTFAFIALALAVVGVYGVVSYSVQQRTQEIGVRLALGAKGPAILQQVIGQAVQLALMGVGFGVVTAMIVTRFQASMLYGVTALDPLTYGALSFTLVLTAIAAAFVPALRASRTNPIFVLRDE